MTTTDSPPPMGHNAPPADQPTLGERIREKAENAAALTNQIAALEAQVKAKSGLLSAILKRDLPSLLAELGSNIWKDDDLTVEVKVKTQAALSRAPDQEGALAYLRSLGFDGAIKSELTADFGDAQFEQAAQVGKLLAAQFGIDVTVSRTVNAQTLSAFARQRIADGLPIDLAKIGGSTWREAAIKET